MSKRESQNERLDRFGRKLLEAARLTSEEIEQIAAAPQLFDSVKARIKAEEQSSRKTKRFFGERATLSFLIRQRALIAYAFLLVSITFAAAVVFKQPEAPEVAEQIIKRQTEPQIIKTENLLPPFKVEETKIPAVKKPVIAEKISFIAEKPKTTVRAIKPNRVKPASNPKKQSQEVFYALTLAGNWETEGEDLQIVRAEISRAELFALGINLPVENETAKIKTDLLVSADGIARAIRFVE